MSVYEGGHGMKKENFTITETHRGSTESTSYDLLQFTMVEIVEFIGDLRQYNSNCDYTIERC